MTDDLSDLKTKLDAADHEAEKLDVEHAPGRAQNRNGGDAMRLAIDLVAAVVIAGAMGYGLDKWLGTKPWFLVIFLIFGLAAGFRNFYVFAGKLLHPNQEHKD